MILIAFLIFCFTKLNSKYTSNVQKHYSIKFSRNISKLTLCYWEKMNKINNWIDFKIIHKYVFLWKGNPFFPNPSRNDYLLITLEIDQ